MAPTGADSNPQREELLDQLLAVRCQMGERAAFDELIDRWHEPLWLYLRRVLGNGDVAAEALQDTWLRALRGFPSLREPARLRSWLFTIARRAAMDRLRRKYAEPVAIPIDELEIAAAEEPEHAERIEVMHAELTHLPVIEREVLVLFYLDELTLEQMAAVLGVPAGTVKSRLFRARRLLREQMTSKGPRS